MGPFLLFFLYNQLNFMSGWISIRILFINVSEFFSHIPLIYLKQLYLFDMKNISLKLQDEILDESDNILRKLAISRNKYFNEAIAFYNRIQQRKLWEEQLAKESQIVQADSLEVLQEFEAIEDEI